MSRRRQQEEEHENHERWLVSYADFITLLFAFFVVMYSISIVNEGKYRVLSDALESAFRNTPGDTGGAHVVVVPISGGKLQLPVIQKPVNAKAEEVKQQTKEKLRDMAQQITSALGPLVQSGQVRITEGARGITVVINASLLFAPGEATLSAEALRALTEVAKVIAPTAFPITVEGYTDNTPISTPQFPSNWELSGVRAASVVRLFIAEGVAPDRLKEVGYADQRPIASNDTPAGRARNRRVAITIESKLPDKQVDVPVFPKNPG